MKHNIWSNLSYYLIFNIYQVDILMYIISAFEMQA